MDIKELPIHPIAEIFPRMTDQVLDVLAEDIRANGLREPIWIHPNGSIVDGRNRYLACQQVNVEPSTRIWSETEHGPLIKFVLSKNLLRRQLKTAQKAMIAARLSDYRPGDRDAQICASLTQEQAAKITNVSRRSVQSARKVVDAGVPALSELVESGQISVSAAESIAGLPDLKQEKIVAKGPKELRAAVKNIKAAAKNIDQPDPENEGASDEAKQSTTDEHGATAEPDAADPPEIEDRRDTTPQPPVTSNPAINVPPGKYSVIVAEPPWQEFRNSVSREYSSGKYDQMDIKSIGTIVGRCVEQRAHVSCVLCVRTSPYLFSDARKMIEQLNFDFLLAVPVSGRAGASGKCEQEPHRDYMLLGLRGDIAVLEAQGLMRWLNSRRSAEAEASVEISDLARQLSHGPSWEVVWTETNTGGNHGKR